MSFEEKAMHEKVRGLICELQDYQRTVIRLHGRVALLEQALRGIRRLSGGADMVEDARAMAEVALEESNKIARERP